MFHCGLIFHDFSSHLEKDDPFVHYSWLSTGQLLHGCELILGAIAAPGFDKLYIHRKCPYTRFLKTSSLALCGILRCRNAEVPESTSIS